MEWSSKELVALWRQYRRGFFELYGVLYRVMSDRVYIYVIADRRCDMRALLARWLLGP